MASAIVAAPIRQPRGPSSNSFGSDPSNTPGPPAPDSESLIRRHNTVSNPRHQPSSSISSTPAASSAFHGARFKAAGPGSYRLRSGSLSSGGESGSLSKKVSGRLVRTEDVVIESGEEGTVETSGEWGKGLSRQSSLPSRRGEWMMSNHSTSSRRLIGLTFYPGFSSVNAVTPASATTAHLEPPRPPDVTPPPRPPRRISAVSLTPIPVASQVSAHSGSLSLSSLTTLNIPNGYGLSQSDEQVGDVTVSRTQSLRAQAKNAEAGALGRSASLRSAGEVCLRAQHIRCS